MSWIVGIFTWNFFQEAPLSLPLPNPSLSIVSVKGFNTCKDEAWNVYCHQGNTVSIFKLDILKFMVIWKIFALTSARPILRLIICELTQADFRINVNVVLLSVTRADFRINVNVELLSVNSNANQWNCELGNHGLGAFHFGDRGIFSFF